MKREWEERARTDPQGYIGRGYADSDAQFWASGEPDLTQLILDGLQVDNGAAVLEIGCGVGRLLRPLSTRVQRAIGVDIAPAMVAQGRQLLADLPNVEFHVTTGRLAFIA
ncbi:MAG: class I SAM-dependent methyltransferase, partial [Opitutaceae bacterium]|nr:class I SAM-dependent methyltransferase [Opitutaceae bacterium]